METEINGILAQLSNLNIHDYINSLLTNNVFSGFFGLSLVAGLAWCGRYLWGGVRWLVHRQFTTSVTFRNNDHAFYWITTWLSHNGINLEIRNSVGITKTAKGSDEYASPRYRRSDKNKIQGITLIPSTGTYLLWRKGIPFLLHKAERTDTKSVDVAEEFTITSFGRSRALINAILQEAQDLQKESDDIKIYNWTGHWSEVAQKSPRPLDSVVLSGGTKQLIVSDLEWFLAHKEWYIERGVPYHRGYMLSGPPGTGKSSLVYALASHFNLSLCVLNLTTLVNDSELNSAFSEAPRDSLILLEDIDRVELVQTAEVKKDGYGGLEQSKVTMSGLLNALDGICASEGRIIMMTSNNPEKLDSAVVRTGRIDIKVEICLPGDQERVIMYRRFFPQASATDARDFVLLHNQGSMADFQEGLVQEQRSKGVV